MSNVIILDNPYKICLSRHGVIEAHAGAGKTHTIVQMVLRILQEPVPDAHGKPGYIHIREILLVTFTEKAAGELKHRIREGLENRIKDNNTDCADHLEDCLNNLHEAFIGTIHGVCLRLLQTWPFETGMPFKTGKVDDAEGLADTLRESMRIDWQDPETSIPWALSQLQATGMLLEEKHFKLVREIAEKLLDKENTVLDRRAIGGNRLHDLRLQMEDVQKSLNNWQSIAGFKSALESLITELNAVSNTGKLEPDRCEMLRKRVSQLREMCESSRYNTKILIAPCKFGRSGIYTQAHLKKIPGLAAIDALCTAISGHSYLEQLKKKEKISDYMALTLFCDAAELLRDRWVRIKGEKGLVSFQDMLRLMHRAVLNNPLFRDALRKRLRYGIIDEFQDTSILQWQIFNRIFLEASEGNGPRLFIVGDPKQSIYSFQGADVQSYLDAKISIEKKNGQVYSLIHNFRSLPETIDGYNSILGRETGGEDWFAFASSVDGKERISYPSEEKNGALAGPPRERVAKPGHPLNDKPVQVMVLEGNAARRRADMAAWTSAVIRSLKGKSISVPQGAGWADLQLDYKDFAVIVEAHGLAEYFLERFQADGIPAVKYKMEGVFQSAMARDLHALLRAVLHPAGDPAPHLAALLTRFFNRHPAAIEPEKDIEPCRNLSGDCDHGSTCISHALEEWVFLSSKHLWSRLFTSIQERTGIRERLVRLADGKRCLADLRQVIDYCIEKLYQDNFSLQQLATHLGRLLEEEETVSQDKNLYTLATEESSVRVLTMHAAKGLEFPIVFVATGSSDKKSKSPDTVCWIEDHKLRVMPVESSRKELLSSSFDEGAEKCPPSLQRTQERRRLLYVAMTRAQAMLFVPVHLAKEKDKAVKWAARKLPSWPDNDLTPRLLGLFDQKKIEQFDDRRWNSRPSQKIKELDDHLDPAWVIPDSAQKVSKEILSQIQLLNIAGRICRQTSYSELSRKAWSDRALDRSEGDDENPETFVAQGEQLPPTALPRGKLTGDALHLALEELLGLESLDSIPGPVFVEKIAQQYLERNRVLQPLTRQSDRMIAIQSAAGIIQAALRQPYELSGKESVTIFDLPKNCRVPEMEFLLDKGHDWVHGYMDLVFRLEKPQAKHPWQYFVLDWKSDSLKTFEPGTIESCMKERHYELQAKIYCHALDRHLKGLLGKDYNPEDNLGGALYVFLRSFENPGPNGTVHSYYRTAEPDKDDEFINTIMGI
jgi:ATP-dependent exoDNAse (exonuclease V) beta subunit (contains helicase and exonuclease domains)